MAIRTLIEHLKAAKIRKEFIEGVTKNMEPQKVEDYMDRIKAISQDSEELGAARERIRILNEITANGPTGEFFEMPWDQLLAIVTNSPKGR